MKCEHAVRVRDELVSNCLAKRVFDMIFGGLCECEWVCVDVFSVIYFCPRRKTIHRDNNDPKGMKILWHLFRCCGHIVANTNNPNQIDRLIKWDKTTATATTTRYNIHCTVANIGWGIGKLLSLTCADRVFPFKSFFCSSARLMNLKFKHKIYRQYSNLYDRTDCEEWFTWKPNPSDLKLGIDNQQLSSFCTD